MSHITQPNRKTTATSTMAPMKKTTPVPNDLLDQVMPTLRDTELRVLLVIVRQTLGWQKGPEPSQRKTKDWLTQSQLMRRTGRASEAVARAVDALVQAGLISVLNQAGMTLRTPAERRRHLGHLYYQLKHISQDVDNSPNLVDNSLESKLAKAHTTKETVIQKIDRQKSVKDKECMEHTNMKETMDAKEVVDSPREQTSVTHPLSNSLSNSLHVTPAVIRTKGWERATRTNQPH